MAKINNQIDWNKDYLKSVKLEDFLEVHKHMKDKVDLKKVWEDHQEKKK